MRHRWGQSAAWSQRSLWKCWDMFTVRVSPKPISFSKPQISWRYEVDMKVVSNGSTHFIIIIHQAFYTRQYQGFLQLWSPLQTKNPLRTMGAWKAAVVTNMHWSSAKVLFNSWPKKAVMSGLQNQHCSRHLGWAALNFCVATAPTGEWRPGWMQTSTSERHEGRNIWLICLYSLRTHKGIHHMRASFVIIIILDQVLSELSYFLCCRWFLHSHENIKTRNQEIL